MIYRDTSPRGGPSSGDKWPTHRGRRKAAARRHRFNRRRAALERRAEAKGRPAGYLT
jgi:hypothetical protein